MQNESELLRHQTGKDDAKNAVAFLIVSPPPVTSVEIENPTRKPQDGFCNWCRNKPGDIFCDAWPICFDCIDILLDRENALAIADASGFGDKWRSDFYNVPMEWEKN